MQLTPATPEAVDALAPTRTLRAAIDPSNFLLVAGEDGEPTPVGRSPARLPCARFILFETGRSRWVGVRWGLRVGWSRLGPEASIRQ